GSRSESRACPPAARDRRTPRRTWSRALERAGRPDQGRRRSARVAPPPGAHRGAAVLAARARRADARFHYTIGAARAGAARLMSEGERTTTTERGQRMRKAPLARATSDVTRFSGVWLASAAGVLAVLAGGVGFGGPSALWSPGPLSPGHVHAGLECQSCHAEEPARAACQGCHAGKSSRRS